MMFPNQVFFDPIPKFIKWFRENLALRYHTIIDVGAGVGRLSAQLYKAGLSVEAIDVHDRHLPEFPVSQQDGCQREYYDRDLVIVARPCHGPFPGAVFRQALDNYAMCLYIGLEENMEMDLEGLVRRHLFDDAGAAGEKVWEVIGDERYTEKWCLIHPSFWSEPNWMIDQVHRWSNAMGGGFDKDDAKCEVLQTEQVIDEAQLPGDWEAILLRPELDSGWITPDGRWLGCKTCNHDAVVRWLLRIPLRHAEATGFVRCYVGKKEYQTFWTRPDHKRLTAKQKHILGEHGFVVEDEETIRSEAVKLTPPRAGLSR